MFWKVLLFIIVVIYLLRLFTRYLLPFLLFNFIKKNSQQFQNFERSQSNFSKSSKKEGDITVDYSANHKGKKIPGNEGEYIDYEEIN